MYVCSMAKNKVYALTIRGLVQGVGFRPFIHRIANELGLKGSVSYAQQGIRLLVAASSEERDLLINRIRTEHPFAATITQLTYERTSLDEDDFDQFTIQSNQATSEEETQVPPDIAVCPDCLRDRLTQPHRLNNPFVNCAHCGPRFSITKALPYERSQTTLADFPLCATCQSEYNDLRNRHFLAQPIGCNTCGPHYYATYQERTITDYEELLRLSAHLLLKGEVLAFKGLGGYYLTCDATQALAVEKIRRLKQQERKPFAVMFRDLDHLNVYAYTEPMEEQCLTTWRRPIVLLRQRGNLAASVNPGMHTLGCLLPYLPIHYDWFSRTGLPALVMTSVNERNLPIRIDTTEWEAHWGGEVALWLHHTLPIYNRVEDSILQVCGGQPCMLRLSRGYVPEPLFVDTPTDGILAFGAERSCTIALGKADTILTSPCIGDLTHRETARFYKETLAHLETLFHFTPTQLVCDADPDYFSSQEAEHRALSQALPLLRVQHHHAHAVACMAEYDLRESVIALVLDDQGLGEDGSEWGGEFLHCDRQHSQRLAHFESIPLPGGEPIEPWRMAVAYLWHYFQDEPAGVPYPADFVNRIGQERLSRVERTLEEGGHLCSASAGKLLDAISSLLGICDVASYRNEAAILLEQTALSERNAYAYPLSAEGKEISFRPLFEALLHDIANNVPISLLAARFHTTLATVLVQKTRMLIRKTKTKQVVLSGTCFQNKLLTETVRKQFQAAGIRLYIPKRIPCNDSGVAVGQLIIAATERQQEG